MVARGVHPLNFSLTPEEFAWGAESCCLESLVVCLPGKGIMHDGSERSNMMDLISVLSKLTSVGFGSN
jgi:hypothetical protein